MKFHYKQRVNIIGGFYNGQVGTIISYKSGKEGVFFSTESEYVVSVTEPCNEFSVLIAEKDLELATPKTMNYIVTDKHVIFWRSPFSNWYRNTFKHKYKTFNCSEQAMMYMKAIIFNDEETATKIMKEKDPKKQQELGRQVKNFDQKVWEEKRLNVMEEILYDKFTSSEDLRDLILQYKDKSFVEGSPIDKIWGVGIFWEDPDADDPTKWKGLNLLGQALTKVKDRIVNESY